MTINNELIIEALEALIEKKNVELEKAEINAESEHDGYTQLINYIYDFCDRDALHKKLSADISEAVTGRVVYHAKNVKCFIENT